MPRHTLRLLLLPWLLFALLLQHAAAVETRSFIWEVRGEQGKAYVLGSIHVGSPELYPLAPAIQKAFEDSAVLGVEADPRQQQGMTAALTQGLYPPGDNLRNHLPPPLVERLAKQLPRYGITIEIAASMKPFMVMTLIEMGEALRAGYDPQQGIDLHFLEQATKRDMKVVELESIEQQMALVDSFSDEEAEALLQQVLASVEKNGMATDLKQMMAAWKAGDADQLERVADRSLSADAKAKDAVMEKINYGRNTAMADKLDGYLKSGKTHFIVVGALHLVGKRGVVELLRKKGYAVRQL